MPTVTADKIIGKGLIAKVAIAKLNGSLQQIGIFRPGDAIGTVFSYIQRGTAVYWMIQPTTGQPFYVQHGSGRFEITEDIKNAIEQQRQEREREAREEEIKQKGAIPYYIEKYGKVLLIVGVGAYLLNSYIQRNR